MSIWLAGLFAVAAITVTYFSCVRPHLRGRGCAATGGTEDAELARQVAVLREELRVLRARDALDGGRVPSSESSPPGEA